MFPAGEQRCSRAKRFTISMLRQLCGYVKPRKYFNFRVEQKHVGRRAFNEISRIHVLQYANPCHFFDIVFFPLPQFDKPPNYREVETLWNAGDELKSIFPKN